jgi:hypothetical protein
MRMLRRGNDPSQSLVLGQGFNFWCCMMTTGVTVMAGECWLQVPCWPCSTLTFLIRDSHLGTSIQAQLYISTHNTHDGLSHPLAIRLKPDMLAGMLLITVLRVWVICEWCERSLDAQFLVSTARLSSCSEHHASQPVNV